MFKVRINGHVASNEMAAVFNTVNMQTVKPRTIVFKAYGNNDH